MSNWKIDGSTGNNVVTGSGLARVTGDDSIAQNLRATLHHVFTEWFLDTTSGIDYFGQILVKRPDQAKIERLLKRAIRNARGIAAIDTFTLTRIDKGFNCTFTAVTENNERFTLSEDLTI